MSKTGNANIYDANDALNEIEGELRSLEKTAEDLIVNESNREAQERGSGIHMATRRLRFIIRNIRRGEGV